MYNSNTKASDIPNIDKYKKALSEPVCVVWGPPETLTNMKRYSRAQIKGIKVKTEW